jgi:hypothetical protein
MDIVQPRTIRGIEVSAMAPVIAGRGKSAIEKKQHADPVWESGTPYSVRAVRFLGAHDKAVSRPE